MKENESINFENEYIHMSLINGIMYGEYKKDVLIDIKTAQEIVKKRIELSKGEAYPSLGKIHGKLSFTKDARDWLGKDGTVGMTKMAILIDSTVAKVVGNWYLTISRPTIPTKLFTSEEEAVKWLKDIVPS